MTVLILILRVLVPLAYVGAAGIYARLFFSEDETRHATRAKSLLLAALLAHGAFLMALGYHYQRCPLGTIGEGLLFLAFILGTIQFLSEWLADTRRLGLFTLLPTAICAVAGVLLLNQGLGLPPEYRGSLFVFHIVASLASYACFSMASVLAGLYLVLHRKLKSKNFDITFRKLPPLDKLDRLSAHWTVLGSATMIAASVLGWWGAHRSMAAGMSLRELTIYLVLAVYLGAGISRRLFSLRGRRHALVVLAGFAVLLLTNLMGSHGFRF